MNRFVFRLPRQLIAILCFIITGLTLSSASAQELTVSSYYGKYDPAKKSPGQHSLSLRGPKLEKWTSPPAAERKYHLGVSFPHLKDSYWLAVNYGIIQEAKKLDLAVSLVEAGGYGNLARQQKQIKALVAQGIDGLILGSISYKNNNKLVQDLTLKGIPVVEVINDIEAGNISAKALVSFYDMGFFAGEHVANQAEAAGNKDIKVAFLPGPQGSGWADETLEGFKAATEFFDGEIKLAEVLWGDTGAAAQSELIEQVLARHPDIDYLVGNAVAASQATGLLNKAGSQASIVSTYLTPPVYEGIKDGSIAAAPADRSADQARIAVGMMVRLLKGEKAGRDFPFRAGPLIPVITQANIAEYPYERLFGPRGFEPVFSLK